MADFDMFSNAKPLVASAAGSAFDGATPTEVIDTLDGRALTFTFLLDADAAWSDISIGFEHSDDNVTFVTADPEDALFRSLGAPTDTTGVFHAGYRGKFRYVRALPNTGGTGSGTACLGYLKVNPVDYDQLVNVQTGQ